MCYYVSMNNFIVYNTHLETRYINAFRPEKQDGYTACHHHHQGKKIDHTKRLLLTHMPPPPKMSKKNDQFLGGGEGVIHSPLPTPPWQEQKGTGRRASAPQPVQNVSMC